MNFIVKEKLHIDEFKKNVVIKFHKLKTINEFVHLLEEVNKYLFNYNIIKEITKQNINYFAFHKKNKYLSFSVAKKNGNERVIYSPIPFLKLIQRNINFILNAVFLPIKPVNGFVYQRNIVSNAQSHTSKPFVYNVDLSNFFPSIKFRRVKSVLELKPFNLTGEREPIAFLIANLCCYNGFLPQGSPTSPTISNIICQRLDKKLIILSKTHKIRYSRYADDITFSSYKNIFNKLFYEKLKKIIEQEQFKLNEKKTRLQRRTERQIVTGLTVNKKVNVTREYIRTTRAMLHNWEKKGIAKTKTIFAKHYKKKHLKKQIPDFKKVLRGRILFIGMVRGQNDDIYNNFKSKYEDLKIRDKIIDIKFINKILYIWEIESIDKAIKIYNQ